MSKAVIISMFDIIDANEWSRLGLVFDDVCVYERPGFPKVSGLRDLTAFYESVRPIARGKHTLETLIEEQDSVSASGTFKGVLRDGTHVDLRFSDLYRVRDGKVCWRTTYFFVPCV